MKKIVSAAIVLVVATLVASSPALAFEASADAYVGVYSKYLWRGFDLSDEDDHFVVQPGSDVTVGDFTLSFWGNLSENTGELNEVDLTLDYSKDLSEMVSVSVGNILYDVDGLADTNELYLGITLNTILAPTLTVYFDYDEFNTVYTTLAIGHSIALSEQAELSLGAAGSYMADDEDGLGTDESWLHNLELTAGIDYTVTENISVSGMVLFSTPLSDDAEDIAGIDDEVTAGVSVSYAF